MRPGTIKVVTAGSIWWFDDDAGEYMRMPRYETPRERPEWSDERAGPLQDGVWHPFIDRSTDTGRLVIYLPVGGPVTAPWPR